MAIRSGLMNSVKILIISGPMSTSSIKKVLVSSIGQHSENILMVRLILKTDFTFHNHDRNTQRITPAWHSRTPKRLGIVKGTLKCPVLIRILLTARRIDMFTI